MKDIAEVLEKINLSDDLSVLSEEERWLYYKHVCEKFGLDPSTRPFAFLTFEDTGKMKLYALRNATDQLRKIHNISVSIVRQERIGDYVYIMTARAKTEDGRVDEAVGAVSLRDEYGNVLSAKQMANAIMTCQTKAIRRVTLSICGVSVLDETEVTDIPTANTLNDSFWNNQLAEHAPTNEEINQLDGLEAPPNLEEENRSEVPTKEDNDTNNEDKSNDSKTKNKNKKKSAVNFEWIEGKATIIAVQKETGKENKSYHVVKLENQKGQELETFAINQLSESLESNPFFAGTEVYYKGKKVKKGILLYELQAVS
jgi:23S rRNA pseudoU1915 N3-methylase RlmH